jgi:hypothetical protein
MSPALECLIDRRTGYTLVELVGALDLSGATRTRAALLKVLTEQPQAIVVDLARVDECPTTSVAVFRAVARQAARWPAIPLLLAGPTAHLTALLPHPSPTPTFTSVTAAAASLGTPSATPMIIDDLLPVSGAARRARDVVTDACLRWNLPDLTGPACIVVSELVNNAVEHAATMLSLRLSLRQRHLCLAVHDGSVAPPQLRRPHLRGHGLNLVDAVAGSWGHLQTTDGKVVWATFPLAAHNA